jgi:hypothetical protein
MLTSLALARMMVNNVPLPPPTQNSRRPDRPHEERLLAAGIIPVQQLAHRLEQKNFLPGVSYGDLLGAVSSGQSSVENALFQRRMRSYNKLNWFQKLFCDAPREQDIQVPIIPFSVLERRYAGRVDQRELFYAVCELREHRVITLDMKHPYQVGMTAKGREVLRLIEEPALLPAYEDRDPPLYSRIEPR